MSARPQRCSTSPRCSSLFSAIAAALLATVIGAPFGLAAGFFGGWVDVAVNCVIEAPLLFLTIVLAAGITTVLRSSLANAVIAIDVVFVPSFAGLMRAATMAVQQELYVNAARALGASPAWLLLQRVVPDAATPVIVNAGLLLGTALLAQVSPSVLGLGVWPPMAWWIASWSVWGCSRRKRSTLLARLPPSMASSARDKPTE